MTDLQDIQHTLWIFFKALHEGDRDGVRARFLPGAEVTCHQAGQAPVDGLEAYLDDLARLPRRPLDFVIDGIEHEGEAARARVSLLRESGAACKVLTLRKRQGTWGISRLVIERD